MAALLACGGNSSIGGLHDGGADGGAGGSSSGGSSGSSSGISVCPGTVPTLGSMCSSDGIACEYGSDPDPACNKIVACQGAGWGLPLPRPPCMHGTCPASYADVPQGADCSPQLGLECAYPQGQCNCAPTVPVSGPNPVWQCSTPSGCPEPRPREGSACSTPGTMCDYGQCTGGVALQCSDGLWLVSVVSCPQ